MSTQPEAPRLNLEYYRKQAKARLKAGQAANPALKLHEVQLAIAREQGFASWPRFRRFVVQSGLDDQALVAAFIEAALFDLKKAEEMLSANPQLAAAGFYAALVSGNWSQVAHTLVEMPEMATGLGGPRNIEPIVYVCFSRFGSRPWRAADLAKTARLILERGGNPNAAFNSPDWLENPLPCLYAAAGLTNNPALAEALLDAGADPNDGESLYHSTEHPDLISMRLLLARGAKPAGKNALKHMLDREDLEGIQLLLKAGADPNELNPRGETALHWAIWRERSTAIAAALLDAGANPQIRRKDGYTAYQMAVQTGQTEVAALLAARGGETEVSEIDRFLGACASATAGDLEQVLASQPQGIAAGRERLLSDLAMNHRTQAVRSLLAAGMPVDARGEMGATALHWACWKGYADLVELLLQHGAPLTVEDGQFHGTPAGWFGHGVRNCGEGLGDYPSVARLLVAAGASIPKPDLPTGNPEVDAVLKELGLI